MSQAAAIDPKFGNAEVQETEQFLRARKGSALFVFWKKPPTLEALDSAITGLQKAADAKASKVALAIVSLAQETPSPEAKARASTLSRQWGSALAVLVMAQEVRGFSAKMNRVFLRTVMAVAGSLSMGPRHVAFVDTPEQAMDALEKGMREAGILEGAPGELARFGTQLVAHCREQLARQG